MSLPFFPQETPYSCVPVCVRMVLARFGLAADEATLRERCGTTALGTTFRDAAACLRDYGLTVEEIEIDSWANLLRWLAQGTSPIVSLNLLPLDGRWAAHAAVVESADESAVTYLDPLSSRRQADRVPFEQAWQMRKGKTLLVSANLD